LIVARGVLYVAVLQLIAWLFQTVDKSMSRLDAESGGAATVKPFCTEGLSDAAGVVAIVTTSVIAYDQPHCMEKIGQ
jgi:hypothetical protein